MRLNEINHIFSDRGKVGFERDLWISVLKAQIELGLDVSADVLQTYAEARNNIDLDQINEIELRTMHDVKASIEAFNHPAAIVAGEALEKHNLKDTIRLYGTPAEENFSGKRIMVNHGLFDDVDATLSHHPGNLNVASLASSRHSNRSCSNRQHSERAHTSCWRLRNSRASTIS